MMKLDSLYEQEKDLSELAALPSQRRRRSEAAPYPSNFSWVTTNGGYFERRDGRFRRVNWHYHGRLQHCNCFTSSSTIGDCPFLSAVMNTSTKRKWSQIGDSDEDEPSLGKQVLPVANLPEDFNGEPMDGLQYLFTVRCVVSTPPYHIHPELESVVTPVYFLVLRECLIRTKSKR